MDTQMGAFALSQLMASTAVVGPILILIGLCYYLFKQDKKSVYIYIVAGVLFTVFGASILYTDLVHERDNGNTPVFEADAMQK